MAQRGVVKPPNEEGPRGNHVNSSGPMGHGAPFKGVPNNENKTARVDGSFPTTRTRMDMPEPNQDHKFKIEDADLGYRGFDTPVAAFGHGAIPVNPFVGKNVLMPAHLLKDGAKK